MRLETVLTHEPGNRHVPRGVLVPLARGSHRPRMMFRCDIRGPGDVEKLRKLGLPIHLVTPDVTACYGYPIAFPAVLVTSEMAARSMNSIYPVQTFQSAIAARDPRLEDLIIVMLRVDPLVARGIAVHHRQFIDPNRLLKRVFQENVEDVATLVRLQDMVPALPISGEQLPRKALTRQDRNAWVGGSL